jgi:hypothetical protein
VVNLFVVLSAFTSKNRPLYTFFVPVSQAPIPAELELVASAASGLVKSKVWSAWKVMP